MIKRIIDSDERMNFEVGVDGVTEIELTKRSYHGNEKTSIYKITYGDDYYEYIGLLEGHHEVIN